MIMMMMMTMMMIIIILAKKIVLIQFEKSRMLGRAAEKIDKL